VAVKQKRLIWNPCVSVEFAVSVREATRKPRTRRPANSRRSSSPRRVTCGTSSSSCPNWGCGTRRNFFP
jgi:hypothetical protein